ncbi:MAG: diguanylate cyclase [Rhodobacteraceae bacterium]|nr:diguanylate cyclase [Paracoccaceae bacterium]
MAGRLLIYDAVASNRIILRCKLSAACYDVGSADTPDAILPKLREFKPDAVILDADADPVGVRALCRSIGAQPAESAPPVLILSSSPDEKIAGLEAGAAAVLPKPLNEDFLLASLRRIMRHRQAYQEACREARGFQDMGMAEAADEGFAMGRVAFLSRNAQILAGWKNAAAQELSGLRLELLHPDAALAARAPGASPDVYVFLAAEQRPMDGFGLLSELRSRHLTKSARVIVLVDSRRAGADDAARQAAMALDLGADDVVLGSFDEAELSCKIRAQIAQKHQLDRLTGVLRSGLRLATRDPLTGLYNRRYAIPRLLRMIEECHRTSRPLALLALDLDRFKLINDTYGHASGDAVLVEVAGRLKEAARPGDLVARSGGEEFLIALPDTGTGEARQVARQMRDLLRRSPVSLPHGGGVIRVTASIGAAMAVPTDETAEAQLDTLMRRADKALYAAKSDGRDTVAFASFAA